MQNIFHKLSKNNQIQISSKTNDSKQLFSSLWLWILDFLSNAENFDSLLNKFYAKMNVKTLYESTLSFSWRLENVTLLMKIMHCLLYSSTPVKPSLNWDLRVNFCELWKYLSQKPKFLRHQKQSLLMNAILPLYMKFSECFIRWQWSLRPMFWTPPSWLIVWLGFYLRKHFT